MQENSAINLIIFILLLLVTVNLFILDLKVFSPNFPIQMADISTTAAPTGPRPTSPESSTNNSFCPSDCLSMIQQATKSGATAIGSPQEQITSSPPPVSNPKEYYIPLGSGSTQKNSWDNITATETTIDFSSYGNVKEAYFIASLRNPTLNGSVEAQLYNVTDKHTVWGSPVTMNGPAEQTITSGKLSIDNGNKLYRVQLKSGLSAPAYLDNARIRILAE